MNIPYHLSVEEAEDLCFRLYGLKGKAELLPGELDHNYRIRCSDAESYILKINRPETDIDYADFQEKILLHINEHPPTVKLPCLLKTVAGEYSGSFTDADQLHRTVRLLNWIPGRLWSAVNPQTDALRYSLGEACGHITHLLQGFNHPKATRVFDWDIAQADWTRKHFHLFNTEESDCIHFFMDAFHGIRDRYNDLRKSVIHNDANDNNIIVSKDLQYPEVSAIIDYGDATYTQTINDLAVAAAYAIMGHEDPLSAALPLVAGYHKSFPLQELELEFLYVLIAMRLVISVTKSAINKEKEPDNIYLQISEKAAWKLLYQWKKIPASFAHYTFRNACDYLPHPKRKLFSEWASHQQINLNDLIPSIPTNKLLQPDLGIGSKVLGHFFNYKNTESFTSRIAYLQQANPDTLLAGGYKEVRPIYVSDDFTTEGNNGPEYRTCHLGLDIWMKEDTEVTAVYDGEIICCYNNVAHKDYGPTVIIKHQVNENLFWYTLYGHLNKASMHLHKKGDCIKKGAIIGYTGNTSENGNWPPHLHFQLILDLLDFESTFPGVCIYNQLPVWESICPDPNVLFKHTNLKQEPVIDSADLLADRKKYLGRSLSLSYGNPLKILRGEMQYLIDDTGRRYLDTVNNVAHAGHEHPTVVKAGQDQMAVLNTNSRYLHENIIAFAKELAKTLPEELSVIHFVNSGSEANELAMRMAQAYTNQKDMIALEVGYHGNTGACINISSYKFDGKGGKGAPESTHIVPLPDSFRGKYRGNKSETGVQYAGHVQDKINDIKGKGRGVSAFIAESIVSCGGQIDLPDHYLKTAYEYVRNAGGVCIADEVQVGFGRVGKTFWGFQLQNVIPDIVTMGKPIGNGHPLAAVACTPAIATAFANGMEFFNTFGGNPVSCAIGLAVLEVIREEQLQQNAAEIGDYLKSSLQLLQKQYPLIGDIRGEGFFLGIELTEPGKIPATAKTSYLANRMKDHGILMSVDGPQNNVLKIKPPMCFNRQNADDLLRYLGKIFKEDYMKV